MNNYEQKKIEMELKKFASLNFERPSDCQDLDQIRFYVQALSFKIEELEKKFDYAPPWIYGLLAQYNTAQNRILHVEFSKTYH